MTRPAHLRPTASPAGRAILCGDPGRAMFLAKELLSDTPKMFNHHRGLWGYVGPAKTDGEQLMVQATGIGGTSLAAVAGELIDLGVTKMIRVGTCTSVTDELGVGSLVVIESAIGHDGASNSINGAPTTIRPNTALHDALALACKPRASTATVRSVDSPDDRSQVVNEDVVDFQTAALLALANARSVSAAAVLIVAGTRSGQPADDQLIESAVLAAGAAAAHVLAPPTPRND